MIIIEEIQNKATVEAIPIDKHSNEIYLLKEHIIIGISPFNSFFTESNIRLLLEWGMKNFKKMNVFVPDTLSSFSLQAMGYSQNDADRKTKRQEKYLFNKINRALSTLEIRNFCFQEITITISSLLNNIRYQELYAFFSSLFETNQDFRERCLSISNEVLFGKKSKYQMLNDLQKKIAVNYLLCELPILMNAPHLLGTNNSLFLYHNYPKNLLEMVKNKDLISPNHGFLEVEIIRP